MKGCLLWLIIREMQIKTTMGYHLISARRTIIKKIRDNKCWWEMWKKEPQCTGDGNVNAIATMEKSMEVLWKVKNRTTVWSSILLPGIYPKERKCLYPHVHCSIIYDNLSWKRWKYQTTWPASGEIYMQVRKQQLELDMEQQTGSK